MTSLVERIEFLIREKGLNFKRVERDCSLGNGTIKRWADQSPRLDKLVTVAQYLQVSLDYLVFGKELEGPPIGDSVNLDEYKNKEGLTCDSCPLSPIETDIIAMYRLIPPSHQEEIFDLLYYKYKCTVEKEKESIYWTYFEGNSKKIPPKSSEENNEIA